MSLTQLKDRKVPTYFSQIQGRFDFPGFYRWVAEKVPYDGVLVEVGVFMGKSVCFLGETLNELNKHCSVFAVDTFQGSPNEPEHAEIISQLDDNLLRVFLRHMVKADLIGRVVPIVGEPKEVAERFKEIPIDFVFIDASHDYDNVRRDIESWLPKVKSGGIIGGHDIDWPDVKKAVAEVIPGFIQKGSVWYYEKP